MEENKDLPQQIGLDENGNVKGFGDECPFLGLPCRRLKCRVYVLFETDKKRAMTGVCGLVADVHAHRSVDVYEIQRDAKPKGKPRWKMPKVDMNIGKKKEQPQLEEEW